MHVGGELTTLCKTCLCFKDRSEHVRAPADTHARAHEGLPPVLMQSPDTCAAVKKTIKVEVMCTLNGIQKQRVQIPWKQRI